MYGTIIIKLKSAQAQLKTWAHDSIAGQTSLRSVRNMSLTVLQSLSLINELKAFRDTWQKRR